MLQIGEKGLSFGLGGGCCFRRGEGDESNSNVVDEER